MNTRLLEGPGRLLESVHPKFIEALILGIDNPRREAVTPQQQLYRDRLMKEIVAQTQLMPWAVAGLFADTPVMRLGLAEKLAGMFDPGHLALTRMSRYLQTLQTQSRGSPELREQYGAVAEQFLQRATHKQRALSQRGLMVQAGEHSDQVFTRWHAGSYDGWSLAGRCFIALEELRWGAFGDACRLANDEVRTLLKENLRSMASQYLAESMNASPQERHFYHQWLTAPVSALLMDYREMLGWLGNECTAQHHPVSWSITQTWQTVALGMPRICSAARLVDAMMEELFSQEEIPGSHPRK